MPLSGVGNGPTFQPGIASGAWISIVGTNLAQSSRTWADADFQEGRTADDAGWGRCLDQQVQVQVSNKNGVSASMTTQKSGASLRIGGAEAAVTFAGLVGPGLHQINTVVPDLPPGAVQVDLQIAGYRTQSGVFLSIGH